MAAAANVVALLSVTGGIVYVGSAVVARHRAQAAADLAALVAAEQLAGGASSACVRARSLATAMHGVTVDCVVHDLDVIVTVDVRLAGGRWGNARAAARAGPGDPAQHDRD